MSDLTNEEIEGRLNAQREALAFLFALAFDQEEDFERLWRLLEERFQFQNNQEDPGVLPSRAFAIEGAMMREFRQIAEDARARRAELAGR